MISNDVTPGFGVPVAAPGLRAAGLAEGLASHGFDVSVSVPSGVIDPIFGNERPQLPSNTDIVDPRELMTHIDAGSFDTVVFCNANMTSHLRPMDGVTYVFDLFAPKLLEALTNPAGGRTWQEMAREKERGFALADHVWVNGKRKLGYALGWLLRPSVDEIRTGEFRKESLVGTNLHDRLTLVEMPVPLPEGISNIPQDHEPGARIRLGVAGYAQRWSSLDSVHPAHQTLADAGLELHSLLPAHWGGTAADAPPNRLPATTVGHDGPLGYPAFARWVQSMDAMVDVFAPSAERRFAMITRSAVALRLGVPLLHGVDSEIADLVREYNAGWVIDPNDIGAWRAVASEVTDAAVLTEKRAGARAVSDQRFAPARALAAAADALRA